MTVLRLCLRRLLHHRHPRSFSFHPSRFFCDDHLANLNINDYLSRGYPAVYSQQECEQFWSHIWEKHELFRTVDNSDGEDSSSFRLLLPPPNITGSLHLGHSLTVAIQDALCRYHRMNGHRVRWYGGTDHAGIATQIIIEKLLWSKQRKTRQQVTREEFEKIFDHWRDDRIADIQRQLRSLGISIDFRADYFTLSEEMSQNVQSAFIDLFDRGLIYRASYMVNWSYHLQSTLSDIEVEHKFISGPTKYRVPGCDEEFLLGVMHRFRYPLDDAVDEFVPVATTRIESVMGDVGLCVHPEDERYRGLIGRFAINPFTGEKMPIVADEAVKPDFGTGVLKLTPGHSPIDREIAERHRLPSKTIFDDRGFIRCQYEPLNGLHRYAAKDAVRRELEKRGLYDGYEKHGHWLPICSRSGDIIESRTVPQWFLRADEARYAAEFVVNRDNLSPASQEMWLKIKEKLDEPSRNMAIIPSGYRNTWKDWFSRYKDWCISRQIFWGHRIPAYEIWHQNQPTNVWVAAKSETEALQLAESRHRYSPEEIQVRQDSDVLDTWFSSGLLPLAVTGWFRGVRFDNQLPLSLMETGHDIIFFWVARMTLLSLMLSGRLPFNRVLLHGMICDEKGKKMSKSQANVVDPLHLINGATFDALLQQNKEYLDSGLITEEKFKQVLNRLVKTLPVGIPVCGADILRLSLLQSRFQDQKVPFELQKTIKKRTFANKMHQTVRFIMINLEGKSPNFAIDQAQLTNLDRWILTNLAESTTECRSAFRSYNLHQAARELERFWIDYLCDIYLENVKRDIFERNVQFEKSMNVLLFVVRNSLRLMHPFMPFITENLYQHLEFALAKISGDEFRYQSLVDVPYPDVRSDSILKTLDRSYEYDMDRIIDINRKIRWFKQTFNIKRDANIVSKVRIVSLYETLPEYKPLIESAVKIDECEVEFVDLYDIYRYDDDDCYCVKIDLDEYEDEYEDESSASSSEDEPEDRNSNSLEWNEIYLLFTVDKTNLMKKLQEKKIKPDKIQTIMEELDALHFKNFTKNYKKLTKIVS